MPYTTMAGVDKDIVEQDQRVLEDQGNVSAIATQVSLNSLPPPFVFSAHPADFPVLYYLLNLFDRVYLELSS